MSIQINSGATYTNNSSVTLTLVAPSGANQMRFSNDNTTFGGWEGMSATKSNYPLATGDGQKTVYVQFGAGNAQIGATESATIILDTTAPVGVTIVINGGAATTSSPNVTLTLTASDATSPVTQMQIQDDTGAWGAWVTASDNAWSTLTATGQRTLGVKFKDAAGNASAAVTASINYVVVNNSITGTWLILKTPDYDDQQSGTQTSYLRIGAADAATENALLDSNGGVSNASDLKDSSGKTYPGWFEYTDGHRTEVTRGDSRVTIVGNETVSIGGTKIDNIAGKYRMNIGAGTLEVSNADPIYQIEFVPNTVDGHEIKAGGKATWRKREWGHNSTESYAFGDTESFFAGYKFDAMFGLNNTAYVGGKIDLSVAATVSASIGLSATITKGLQFALVDGKDLRVVKNQETKARDSIHLRIKAAPSPTVWTGNKIAAALVAAAGGATVVGLAAGTKHGDIRSDGYSSQVAGCLSAAAGVFAASLAASVFLAMRDPSVNARSRAEVKLDSNGVEIKRNNAFGNNQAMMTVGSAADGRAIEIRNSLGSTIQLDPQGDITLGAHQDLQLATAGGNAVLFLRNNGDFLLNSTTAGIAARQVALGPNNELMIQ